jgi:hypothetical protein
MISINIDTARKWPRPLMAWVCIPLIPVAVALPYVGADKLALILGFAAALYGIRAWERRPNAPTENP